MNKYKPILLLVLVFIQGTICGVVGTRLVIRHWVRLALQHPDRVWILVEHRLAVRLDLTPEQRTRTSAILATARHEFQQLRAETQPRHAAIVERLHGELIQLLTPDQREQF